jgi:hypothetical protein
MGTGFALKALVLETLALAPATWTVADQSGLRHSRGALGRVFGCMLAVMLKTSRGNRSFAANLCNYMTKVVVA